MENKEGHLIRQGGGFYVVAMRLGHNVTRPHLCMVGKHAPKKASLLAQWNIEFILWSPTVLQFYPQSLHRTSVSPEHGRRCPRNKADQSNE